MKHLFKKILPQSVISKYKFHQIDAFIISYPKCGRSWLRLMLGYYINKHFQLDFQLNELTEVYKITRSESGLPTIRFTHDDDPHRKRLDEIDNDKSRYKNKRIIFLIRDPRDVVVSYYFHLLEGDGKNKTNLSIADFTFSEHMGLKSIIKFYNIWAYNFDIIDNLFIVRYEEMVHNPTHCLTSILKFLGFEYINPELVEETVEFAKFENIKRMEKSGNLKNARFGGENKTKARKGVVGGYKNHYTKNEIIRIDSIIADTLDDLFGY